MLVEVAHGPPTGSAPLEGSGTCSCRKRSLKWGTTKTERRVGEYRKNERSCKSILTKGRIAGGGRIFHGGTM